MIAAFLLSVALGTVTGLASIPFTAAMANRWDGRSGESWPDRYPR